MKDENRGRRLVLLLFSLALCFSMGPSCVAADDWQKLPVKSPFLVSATRDVSGNLWFGSEDSGIWRYKCQFGKKEEWQQFATEDGLGGNQIYALACDKMGRIWAGHLNTGVSVFNGVSWKNYSALNGPIGERIFRIACCPTDGDVWMATSAGLTRYSMKDDTWRHYTREKGLPADQANAIAFDSSGNIYVGFQCHGVAFASAADQYKSWRTFRGPDHPPTTSVGTGLPSDLVNDILVAADGMIYVATTGGLAYTKSIDKDWTFVRGKDWREKVRNSIAGPPAGWRPDEPRPLLLDDYVTCVTQSGDGSIWLGFQSQGLQAFTPALQSEIHRGKPADYIKQIIFGSDGGCVVCTYGSGAQRSEGLPSLKIPLPESLSGTTGSKQAAPPFPASAAPPSRLDLARRMREVVTVLSQDRSSSDWTVISLADDWKTQGNWLGRYGRSFCCLCACRSPYDLSWTPASNQVPYNVVIGPHHKAGDSVRYWVSSLYTAEPRTLELPNIYLDTRVRAGYTKWSVGRRQAEWDDHGEAYPRSYEGPDLYCSVEVPPGTFVLSLYDFNSNGHASKNRYRDFLVSVRAGAPHGYPDDMSAFESHPELARARISDFWGGVWKRFLVKGPQSLTVRIARNYSFNTLLAGLTLDPVEEKPAPYFSSPEAFALTKSALTKPIPPEAYRALLNPESATPQNLFALLEHAQYVAPDWVAAFGTPYYRELALTSALKSPAAMDTKEKERLASIYYRLHAYEKWETLQKTLGKASSRDIEKSMRQAPPTEEEQPSGFLEISKRRIDEEYKPRTTSRR